MGVPVDTPHHVSFVLAMSPYFTKQEDVLAGQKLHLLCLLAVHFPCLPACLLACVLALASGTGQTSGPSIGATGADSDGAVRRLGLCIP